jgi:protein-S-isoprenylcysteine O-methyltransferase Ste14
MIWQEPKLTDHAATTRQSANRDLLARAVVVFLFGLMSVNLFTEFLRTGHLTGLLLVVSESFVVVLTIARRSTPLSDRSIAAAAATTVSFVAPALVRAGSGIPLAPDALTASVSAVGVAIVILSKATLGRSFGIAPANRGVVASGPYTIVRHPIYAGYIISHLAFAIAHPSPWNIVVLAVGDGALVARALFEERFLKTDDRYRHYCARVGWHLVPGVF